MDEPKGRREQQGGSGRELSSSRRASEILGRTTPMSGMFGLNPFSLMRQITEEMDQAFRGANTGRQTGAWAPALDVQHCNGNLVVSAELPGLKKDDVNVEITDDTLILSGERKQEHQEDHEGFHRFERSYGHFYRSVSLPQGANADQIRAEMKDGLLTVTIPVAEPESRSRKIKIEESSGGRQPGKA